MEKQTIIATANRACSLLYSYIREHADGTWLLPVNVCPDVPLTFCLAKVPFRFVDIDPKTLCIDIAEVLRLLGSTPASYKGLLYVRTYGILEETQKEFGQLKSINDSFLIIDDRCLCIPQKDPHFWGADMILYSTGHCKQIDLGGGGIAFYNNNELYKIDTLLEYDGTNEEIIYKDAYKQGRPLENIPRGWLKMEGYLTPDDYFAKIKEAISERLAHRELINKIYANNLPLSIQMNQEYQTWRFNVKVEPCYKDEILSNLFEQGLFASNHYRSVNRLFDNIKYPNSDNLYDGVINLFNDKHYSENQAIKTCEIINSTLRK